MQNFKPSELRTLRAVHTPAKIQAFLDRIPYHLADTAFSPQMVLREKTAHCLEGAIFAAAALRVNGYPPLILDLEATNDTDHVIAVYRENGAWGSIASSNFTGCRFRPAIYRTLRELVLSYFNDYFNKRRQRTLRAFSRPVNLKRFDHLNWMTRQDNVWFIVDYLFEISHTDLITPKMERMLNLVDQRGFHAGTYGMRIKKN